MIFFYYLLENIINMPLFTPPNINYSLRDQINLHQKGVLL